MHLSKFYFFIIFCRARFRMITRERLTRITLKKLFCAHHRSTSKQVAFLNVHFAKSSLPQLSSANQKLGSSKTNNLGINLRRYPPH